jgi:Tfp pilus assembly protein PilF
MKLFLAVFAVLTGAALLVSAQSLDETYVQIYSLIQQGDQLLNAGQPEAAALKFSQAEERLKEFKTANPSWNPKIISFRLRYVAERLQQAREGRPPVAATARPAAPPRPRPVEPPAPVSAPAPATTPVPAADDARALTAPLERQIRQLEAEKATLEAKLREALSAQPAAVDPRELSRAQEQIRILQKENEILKVSLSQEKERAAKAVDPAMVEQIRSALADSNRKLAEQADAILALRTENSALKTQIEQNPQLARLRAQNSALAQENQSLKTEVGTLKQELETLRPQLTAAAADLARQMAEARTQLAAQQKRLEELTRERDDLDRRLRSAPAAAAPAPNVATSATPRTPATPAPTLELEKRVAVLEQELSESRRLMAAAAEQLQQLQQEKAALVSQVAEYALATAMAKPAPGAKAAPARSEPAPDLELLRARIASLEAKPVPYTAEELALFQVARAPSPPETKGGKLSARVLPTGAATLVSQAERAFQERRLDEAEKLYQQAVKLDTRNAYTLANLAAIQLEQGRYAEAETHLRAALESAPDDAFSLSLLGISKFRQNQFDEALNYLSRAAQLDPGNAETQNYLGVAFSQKGLRVPAETALRRAVQLAPGYASAHHNLAVVYATAQPPALELARYHYGKARAAGHPQNAELEKILNPRAAAAN